MRAQDKDMWKTTLMVSSADNGGAQYMSPRGYQLWGSGNNLPLRGGKTSEFEGGIRVNSFVTGGFLPPKMRGHTTNALIQFADWLGTFAYLAGADVNDEEAIAKGLPPIDSINQWPIISGETTEKTLRSSLVVSPVTLIDYGGKYKLLTGPDPGSINSHTSPGKVPFQEYAVGCARRRLSHISLRPSRLFYPVPGHTIPMACLANCGPLLAARRLTLLYTCADTSMGLVTQPATHGPTLSLPTSVPARPTRVLLPREGCWPLG